jgi:hypothetical protein
MMGKAREEELGKVKKAIQSFIKKQDKLEASQMFLISGSYGVGKSLFIRKILEVITASNDKFWKYKEKVHIIVSNLNCQSKLKRLNGWRTVFRDILNLMCLRLSMKPETLMISILEKDTELLENIHCVEEILDLRLNTKKKLKPEKLEESEQEYILAIMMKLLKSFVEEHDDVVEKQLRREGTLKHEPKDIKIEVTAPVFIALDDMQDYDPLSWEMTSTVLSQCNKVMVFGAYRDSYCELLPTVIR